MHLTVRLYIVENLLLCLASLSRQCKIQRSAFYFIRAYCDTTICGALEFSDLIYIPLQP